VTEHKHRDAKDQRQALRDAIKAIRVREFSESLLSPFMDWQLQTSNSFRRIGLHGDGDVLCATKLYDGHPDLLAAPGVLEYIIAAQPRVVKELLDDLEASERARDMWQAHSARIDAIEMQHAADLLDARQQIERLEKELSARRS